MLARRTGWPVRPSEFKRYIASWSPVSRLLRVPLSSVRRWLGQRQRYMWFESTTAHHAVQYSNTASRDSEYRCDRVSTNEV